MEPRKANLAHCHAIHSTYGIISLLPCNKSSQYYTDDWISTQSPSPHAIRRRSCQCHTPSKLWQLSQRQQHAQANTYGRGKHGPANVPGRQVRPYIADQHPQWVQPVNAATQRQPGRGFRPLTTPLLPAFDNAAGINCRVAVAKLSARAADRWITSNEETSTSARELLHPHTIAGDRPLPRVTSLRMWCVSGFACRPS